MPKTFSGRRVSTVFELLILVVVVIFVTGVSSRAHASGSGPQNYFVVQKDIDDIGTTFPGSSEIVHVALRKGQVVHLSLANELAPIFGGEIVIEKKVNGQRVATKVKIPGAQMREIFGSKMNPATNDPDQMLRERQMADGGAHVLRLDDSPYTLGATPPAGSPGTKYYETKYYPDQTASGGTKVSVEETEIVDLGAGAKRNWTLVHKICLQYEKTNQRCGWVTNEYLSRGEPDGHYHPVTANANSPSNGNVGAGPSPQAPCPNRNSAHQIQTFVQGVQASFAHLPAQEQQARAKMEDAIGECAVPLKEPAAKLPTAKFNTKFIKIKGGFKIVRGRRVKQPDHFKEIPDTNMYDAFARAAAKKAFRSVAKDASKVIVREADGSSHRMNESDFVAIDAFARTLFGEMRNDRCTGKPYVEAVARTIINRSMIPPENPFTKNAGLARDPISKACLANMQYSVWNNDDEVRRQDLEGHKENLKVALCPASDPHGSKAWAEALEAATHAYLDRKAFLKETEPLANYRSYTSNIPTWPNHRKMPPPTIYGKTLDDPVCMGFWTEWTK